MGAAILNCDECANFVPFGGHPDDMPDRFNPCVLKHKMLFKTPQSMTEVNSGDWGFHRPNCKDRVTAFCPWEPGRISEPGQVVTFKSAAS